MKLNVDNKLKKLRIVARKELIERLKELGINLDELAQSMKLTLDELQKKLDGADFNEDELVFLSVITGWSISRIMKGKQAALISGDPLNSRFQNNKKLL